MTITIHIPPELHQTLSGAVESISGATRAMIAHAANNPDALVAAFAARALFTAHSSPVKRFAIYMPHEEKVTAKELASRYLLSPSQLVQILVEDMLYRAGLWPEKSVG